MKTIETKLGEIKANGFELDFSATLSKAIDIYKNMILTAGLASLVFGIALMVLWFGIMAGLSALTGVAIALLDAGGSTADFVVIAISSLSMALAFALASPFVGGLFMMSDKAQRGEEVFFSDAFSCYKPPYFGALITQAMLISGTSVCITLLLQFIDEDLALLGGLVSTAISFLTMFVVPLIVFGKLKPLAAIAASPGILFKKFWYIIGLAIVAGFMASVGLVALCIGIVFTYPFIFTMNYTIYREAVGIENENEIEDIGSSDFL